MRRKWGFIMAGALLLLRSGVARGQSEPPAEGYIWPNAFSKANSDEWLRLHHNEIRQMRPRVLVLNFVNGLSTDEARRRAEAVAACLRESSRYHGYKKQDTPVFLDYQIAKVVDFTDEAPLPEEDRKDGNSTQYPRPSDWKPGMVNFQYSALFSDAFTQHYRMTDTDNPNRPLSLGELLAKGMVHEVWILALQGNFGAPVRCAEVKQAYSAELRKIPGKYLQAGSGAAEDLPFPGRSLRVLHINPERGAGCALESLGYALEGLYRAQAVPYFSRYFAEFAGFDFKTRYKMPFNSFYEREGGTELTYPEHGGLIYTRKGERFRVSNYIAAGGNVHFCPAARREFDIFQNPTTVPSTIENYRLRNGLDGNDKVEPWSIQRFQRFQSLAPDCSGAWMVYWRQNMPGYGTKAKDDAGKPMKNWWVFLFY
jgi:hypothetical protein